MKSIKPSEDFVNEMNESRQPDMGDNPNSQIIPQQQSPSSQPLAPQTPQSAAVSTNPTTIEESHSRAPGAPEPILDTAKTLVGSQMAQVKVKLPVGLWLIIGWTLIGIVTGLFDQSQTSLIYTIGMVFALCTGVALIFRLEGARKAMLWVCGMIIVLSVLVIALTYVLHNQIDLKKASYENAISHIDQQSLTEVQKQQISEQKAQLDALYKTVGKMFAVIYIKYTINLVIAGVVIYYLRSPKVKKVFHSLPS